MSEALLEQKRREYYAKTIEQHLEDHYGPNPCQQMRFVNRTTGELITLVCDRKRCVDCGPRKKLALWLAIRWFGDNAWIGRLPDSEVAKVAAVARQRRLRTGKRIEYIAIPTGEPQEMFLVSNVELAPEQRYMALDEWRVRILEGYHRGRQRLRKTHRVSSVTVSPKRRRAKRDRPTKWEYWGMSRGVTVAIPPDEWAVWEDEEGQINTSVKWRRRTPEATMRMAMPT